MTQDFEAYYIPGAIFLLACTILIYYQMNSTTTSNTNIDMSTGLLKESKGEMQDSNESDKVLNAATFKNFKIIQIIQISHNTKLFRCEITGNRSLGLGIGRHISVRGLVNGNHVIRAYTPTSHPAQEGYFDLLIKSYEMGKLSPYLHSLAQGDMMEIRGPIGRFKYTPNQYSKIGLIAGGTGLTPCLQVIRCILSDDQDHTSFIMLYQNRTAEDILLKDEIDALMNTYPNRLQVIYFLSNPPATSTFGTKSNERKGYITLDAVHEHMSAGVCPFVGICGPSGFNDCMKGILKKVAHNDDTIYVW